MKRVFISQPMRGLSASQILADRQKAIENIRTQIGDDFSVIDSLLSECNRGPVWCLGRSICMMETADAVYFVTGYQDARGCNIERMVAEQYGIEILEDLSHD